MKTAVKNMIQRFFLSLGVVFLIGIVISKDFRDGLAEAISPILNPLFQTFPIHAVIFILAIFTATYTTVIQRYAIDFQRFKEVQKKVMDFQKEYMDATKKNDQAKLKKLEPKREEVQKLQGEMMGMQFKPMFYSGIVTIPIIMWLWMKTNDNVISLNVPFHASPIHVSDPILSFLPFPWWIFWYILASILISQVEKKVLKLG
ncbi:MAG: EMC3/TMCO1 family protein [Archaeoglobaceae archaeon]